MTNAKLSFSIERWENGRRFFTVIGPAGGMKFACWLTEETYQALRTVVVQAGSAKPDRADPSSRKEASCYD